LAQVPLAALGQATGAEAAAATGAFAGAVVPAVAMLMLPITTPAISAANTRAVTFFMLIEYLLRVLAHLRDCLFSASIGGTCEEEVNALDFRE
jgi:hypothetical protein